MQCKAPGSAIAPKQINSTSAEPKLYFDSLKLSMLHKTHGTHTAFAPHDIPEARLLTFSQKPVVIPFLQRIHRPLYSIR